MDEKRIAANIAKHRENMDIAKRYLYLELTIRNLLLDLKYIHEGPFRIKNPYITFIEAMLSHARKEMRRLKQLMHQRGIQVNYLHQEGDFTTYEFIAAGKEEEKTYLNPVLKKHVQGVIETLEKEVASYTK